MHRRILATAVLLTLAACGGAPTAPAEGADPAASGGEGSEDGGDIAVESNFEEVFAEVEGLEDTERRDALVALAAEEDPANWYTSLNEEVAGAVLEAYAEDTGLDVSLYRAGSETVRNRVVEEASAGFAGSDVVETNGPEMVVLADAGVFEPFTSPVQDALVEDSAREAWTATRFNIFAVGWNTDLVPEAEVPTEYADLADPTWDGRMAMEIEDYDWYWALWNHLVDEVGMSEEETDAYFAEMADGAAFTSGHTTMRQLLVAGEYALVTSDYSYGIAEVAEDGAPVAWEPPVEPLFARPNGIALVRNAPNPAAALTFAEWLLSDGQQVLLDSNIDPTREDLLDTGDADVQVLEIEEYLAEQEDFVTKYEDLARAGEMVDG